MSADASSTRRNVPVFVALIFGANAATQFAIQAVLAYGFAAHVWGLTQPLPFAVPFALDLFAINLMAFAYILRHAPLRQRAYVWFLLFVVIAAQVLASEGFADHEGWSLWGRGASIFPAIFLASSLHALIMAARRREAAADGEPQPGPLARWLTGRRVASEIRRERRAFAKTPKTITPPAPRVIQSTTAEVAAGAAPVRIEAERPAAPPEPPPVSSGATPRPVKARRARPALPAGPRRGREADPRQADVVKRVIEGGEDAKTVALELGVNPRTAQLWVKHARERAERDGRAGAPAG